MHKFPNFSNPITYNEKLNWLKLYYRPDVFTTMVDKLKVKDYVSARIGVQHVIPVIGVWDTPENIDWESLPQKFVLKTTHGGGNAGVVICKDKTLFDKEVALKKIKKAMKQESYKLSREWPYKNVEKRIFAEKYMEDEFGELRDYKFFCFYGKVKALFVATDRQKRNEPYFNFFDDKFTPLAIKQGHPVNPVIPQKPDGFEKMVSIAEQLSSGIPHARIDLYMINGKVYFGEYTFFHFAGVVPFEPDSWDVKWGEWLKLPQMEIM